MFGIGSTELLVILVVALIVLGPKSLASVSRSLGKAMGEFRRVSTDFQRTLNAESAEADLREKAAAQRREAAREAAANAPAQPSPDGAGGPPTADAPADSADEDEHSLTAPEGSPLAEALAKARAEAEGASAAGNAAGEAAASAPDAASGTAAPLAPTPPADGPRA